MELKYDKQVIEEAYREDTVGRKYHAPIVSKAKWGDVSKNKDGEVTSYNLDRPMKLCEFKSLPHEIQQKYLDWLVSKYHVSTVYIGRMLGYTCESGLFQHAKRHGLKIPPKKGQRMTETQKAEWQKFLQKDVMADAPVEQPVEIPEEPVVIEEKPKSNFTCDLLEFRASGEFDLAALMNYITVAVPDGTNCKVYVRIEKQGDKQEVSPIERF